MSEKPPVVEGRPPTEEEKRLVALFAKIEEGQLDLLDGAGKRVIELTTALLGVLFAVTAFGGDFPPPYLAHNTAAKVLAILTLGFYLGAMAFAMWTLQPRNYRLYRHNLTRLRGELDRIIAHKSGTLKVAGILFWLGSLYLALLIVAVILSA